jgi:DNA-directed RNA polymerase specialized sigma24 family protein
MSDLPITQWIAGAKRHDPDSERALWNHYFERVVRLARSRMFALQGSVYDEEDAAISAINSVFRGLQTSRFPNLHDRSNLWRILVLVTKRKLRAQWRRETAQRRGEQAAEDPSRDITIEEVICEEPSPDFVAQMMDQTEHLLDQLADETLRRIAILKLDGFTNDEIAIRLQCTSRTIRRKMERIRDRWGISDQD